MSIQSNFPAIKPTLLLDFSNTEALDSRVTFTRASTATYYGTQTAKAEENLMLFSQEFDNSRWSKVASTVTANATTAPDGTTTAESLLANTGTVSPYLWVNQGVFPPVIAANTVGTHSVFLKKNTNNFAQIWVSNGGVNSYANFDLDGGTLGTAGAGVTNHAITSVGDGWYRCSMTFTSADASTGIGIAIVNSSSATRLQTFSAAGTESIYVWGAQTEQRSSVTAYTPTTTQPITNYIPVLQTAAAGVARFDHNPITGESLGLLIEEQRTNLLLRSEEFDNASWTKNASSITANTIIAPDGTLTGDAFNGDGTTAAHSLVQFEVLSQIKTASIYAKKGSSNFLQIGFDAYLGYANFDLNAGTVATTSGGATASIQSVGNGWYRCSCTANTTSATTTRFGLVSSGSAGRFESWSTSGSIYIWGAQIEAGAFPTSYIPTTTAQVTRSADAASMTGANFSSWYRQDQGTLYAEAATTNGSDLGRAVQIASTSGTFTLGFRASGSTTQTWVEAFIPPNPYVNAFSTGGNDSKISFTYAVNSAARAVDGTATEISSVVASYGKDATAMWIGRQAGSVSQILNGTIKKIAFYPIRATNAQLQALTQN
jgi:hypothetical protein